MGLRRSAPAAAAPIDNSRVAQLSIQKLSEPLLAIPQPDHIEDHKQRISDVSSNAADNNLPTPASLETDLNHYKDLFRKLRFSYTSQVTKEKFLRNLVANNGNVPTASQNSALESTLLSLKSDLNDHKKAVAELLVDLETQARELTKRHAALEQKNESLQNFPAENEALRKDVQRLRQELNMHTTSEDDVDNDFRRNENMHLPLSATLDLLGEREAEIKALDEQLASMGPLHERKAEELGKLEADLEELEKQKVTATASANEARRRREKTQDGIADEVEEKGRWLRAVEITMNSLLAVDA